MDIRIQKLIVECILGDHTDPLQFNDDAEDFVKRKVLPLLEELLSDLEEDFKDISLAAAELQVDLEELLGDNMSFNQVSKDTLRPKLLKEILSKILDEAENYPDDEGIWYQFFFIVANGYTPWNFYQHKHSGFEQLLISNKDVVRNNAKIRTSITRAIQQHRERYRIATLFSAKFILEILPSISESPEVEVADAMEDLNVIIPLTGENETTLKKYLLLLIFADTDATRVNIAEESVEILSLLLKDADPEGMVAKLKTELVKRLVDTVVSRRIVKPATVDFKSGDAKEENVSGQIEQSVTNSPISEGEHKMIPNADEIDIDGVKNVSAQSDQLLISRSENNESRDEDNEVSAIPFKVVHKREAEDLNDNPKAGNIKNEIVSEEEQFEKLKVAREIAKGNNEQSVHGEQDAEMNSCDEKNEAGGKSNDIENVSAEKNTAIEEKRSLDATQLNKLLKNYSDEPLVTGNWRKEGIYVSNAGAVLLAPYLTGFFGELGLLDGTQLKNQSKAVHLLQLLTGSKQTEEYNLALNKILCGLEPEDNIDPLTEFEEKEVAEVEALLKAVLEHWKALKNTSIETLQTSFLQRDGKIHGNDEMIYLEVEKKTEDVLLSYVPWAFKMIKLPWMKYVLNVNWD